MEYIRKVWRNRAVRTFIVGYSISFIISVVLMVYVAYLVINLATYLGATIAQAIFATICVETLTYVFISVLLKLIKYCTDLSEIYNLMITSIFVFSTIIIVALALVYIGHTVIDHSLIDNHKEREAARNGHDWNILNIILDLSGGTIILAGMMFIFLLVFPLIYMYEIQILWLLYIPRWIYNAYTTLLIKKSDQPQPSDIEKGI